MDKFWMTFGLLSLLAALVPWPVQAQPCKAWGPGRRDEGEPQPGGQAADPALLPPAVAQRRTLLVGLGAALAFLFLLFVLMVVYALWCGESLDRWAPSPWSPAPSLNPAPVGALLSTGPDPKPPSATYEEAWGKVEGGRYN